jgi:hypothetical protein
MHFNEPLVGQYDGTMISGVPNDSAHGLVDSSHGLLGVPVASAERLHQHIYALDVPN